ncbi:hypothetical protein RUM43_008173 [Polyplax serrata]
MFSVLLGIYLRLFCNELLYEIGIRSVFLGTIFAIGLLVAVNSSWEMSLFGVYMCVMSFFHYSEFLAIAWCNPRTLSTSSFLLNHSVQYNIAAVASWLEFALEIYIAPSIKRYYLVSSLGFLLCVIGEIFRKTAMITGSTNFDHIVQTEKNTKHELVTHGIYSLCRHPSYVGWFYWAIGTQVLLLNPLCTVCYTIVSWQFFNVRIHHEEHTLLYFFGRDYLDYQKRVGTGLPGIKGFSIQE